MTRVQRRASLHEKAVQKVARDEVSGLRRGRGPTRTRIVLSSRRIKVHPAVWKLVRQFDIDPLCVEVLSEENIVIWNHRAPWPDLS